MSQGEIWRPITGQLTHWSWSMAMSDLAVVAAAGAWIERRSRRLAVAGMGAALLAVAAAVVFAPPGFSRYRGSSGVATALVALAATDHFRRGSTARSRRIGLAVLAVLATKVAVEAVTGASVFAWTLPSSIAPAAAVHVAGAVTGVAVALRGGAATARGAPSPPTEGGS